MQINMTATRKAFPASHPFAYLSVVLTDASGESKEQQVLAADIADGATSFTVAFAGVPAGNFSVRVQAYAAGSFKLGSEVVATGVVPVEAAPNTTFPQVVSMTFSFV